MQSCGSDEIWKLITVYRIVWYLVSGITIWYLVRMLILLVTNREPQQSPTRWLLNPDVSFHQNTTPALLRTARGPVNKKESESTVAVPSVKYEICGPV